MVLTLEVTGPEAEPLGSASRKTIDSRGTTIGRVSAGWVLPHSKVLSSMVGHRSKISDVIPLSRRLAMNRSL